MLLIIDSYSLLYRLFYAIPELTHNGIYVNSIYGLVKLMIKLIKQYLPEYLIFCVDRGKSSRTKIDKSYKAHRKPISDKFKQQIPIFYEFIKASKFFVYSIEETEADDTIFSLVNYFKKNSVISTIFVLTSDKDILQFLDKNVWVLLMKKGISEIESYNLDLFRKKYGFDSNFFIYYKALIGDSADNIKGIKGIGPKKALNIINQYSNSQNFVEDIKKLLSDEEFQLFNKNLDLIRLRDYSNSVQLDISLAKLNNSWYRNKEFIDFLKKYNFASILKDIEDRQLKFF